MAVDDVIGLEIQGSLNAGLWQQKYYYKITTDAAIENNNPIEVVKAWDAIVSSPFLAAVSTELTIDCGTAQKVFPLPKGNTFIQPLSGESGDLIGESLPATVAGLITTLTDTPGRQTRGRKYIPGIRELDQKGGRVLSAEFDLLVALASALESQISFDMLVAIPVIAHRDPVTPFEVLSTADITACTTRPRLGNQRRRRTFRTNIQ